MEQEKYCSVLKCDSKHPEVIMHKFPKRHDHRFLKWLKACGNKKQLIMNHQQLSRTHYICRRHFAPQFLTDNNRISRFAVPTLHLPEPIDVDISDSNQKRPLKSALRKSASTSTLRPDLKVSFGTIKSPSSSAQFVKRRRFFDSELWFEEDEEGISQRIVRKLGPLNLLQELLMKDEAHLSQKQEQPYQAAVRNLPRLGCDTLKSYNCNEKEDALDAFGRMISMELRIIEDVALQKRLKRNILNAVMDAREEDRKVIKLE